MATLIQLGRRVINLDLVFEIEDYGDRLRIFYAVSSSDTTGAQQPAYADVEGQEAERLRAWLTQQAVQLPGAEGEHETEVTRAVGASSSTITPSSVATAAPTPTGQPGDDGFYGVERMRQMHGAGSSTGPAETGDGPPDAGS
jgi:hypothetical protein